MRARGKDKLSSQLAPHLYYLCAGNYKSAASGKKLCGLFVKNGDAVDWGGILRQTRYPEPMLL